VATFIEGATLAGGAIGLALAVPKTGHHHAATHPCFSATAAANCIGQATRSAAMPYVIGGFAGAAIGLALAVGAILAWRALVPTKTPAKTKPRRKPIPERVRHEVWRRDEGSCVDCGSREFLEFDHIVPVSRGGSNSVRNIELRCEGCNGRKGAWM
jgi:HNH endonuclease